ncbi:MAG: pentapeptide repeat-containing protein, partial [Acidimicrobiales bacterium]
MDEEPAGVGAAVDLDLSTFAAVEPAGAVPEAKAAAAARMLAVAGSAAGLLDAAVFDAAVFDAAVFDAAVFDAAVFDAAVFDAAVFAGAVFAGAVFAGAVFAGAVFAGAVFAGAALAAGLLDAAVFMGAVFAGAGSAGAVFALVATGIPADVEDRATAPGFATRAWAATVSVGAARPDFAPFSPRPLTRTPGALF